MCSNFSSNDYLNAYTVYRLFLLITNVFNYSHATNQLDVSLRSEAKQAEQNLLILKR